MAGGGGCGAGLQVNSGILLLRRLAPGVFLALVRLEMLRDHEQVNEEHLNNLLEDIRETGIVRRPILADSRTLTILDGHHRVNALRRLGAKWAPAVLVDYMSGQVEVSSWRPRVEVSKEEVLRRAMRGELYPPKTTRHIVLFSYPEVNIRIRTLMYAEPHKLEGLIPNERKGPR